MKSVFLALVLCCLGSGFAPQAHAAESKSEMSVRASQETIARLNNQVRALKGAKASSQLVGTLRCDPNQEPEPTTCVLHCISRFSDGRCAQYGQDFCGPNAACVEHCISRFSDGRCAQYTDDNCGPWASCSANCISRFSDGRCAQYGEDICN